MKIKISLVLPSMLAATALVLVVIPARRVQQLAEFGQSPAPANSIAVRAASPPRVARGADPSAWVAANPPNLQMHAKTEDAPAWAIGFGKEFWRRPSIAPTAPVPSKAGDTNSPLPASLNLGDLIERVHHALGTNDAGTRPEVKAGTYTAAFDGESLRFSPHRPAEGEAFGVRRLDAAVDPTTPRGAESVQGNGEGESAVKPAHSKTLPHTAPAPTADPAVEARFGTISVRRDGVTLFDSLNPQPSTLNSPWSVLGNTAQSLLNADADLIEHYEVREEGVAVTWVLQRAPAGNGPLVVEAELEGLTYAGQSGRGHHFADANGTPRVRVGNVTLVDAAGHRWDATTTAKGQRLRVTVPESILAQAAYPLAIDPVIGPEFGMDDPVVRPGAGFHANSRVACNGAYYLVVWAQSGIYGCRITLQGVVLDPQGIAISPGWGYKPRVAASGEDFLVVWATRAIGDTEDLAFYAARVTEAGVVLDPEGISLILDTEDDDSDFDVAGNGLNWMVVWEDRRQPEPGLHIARISRAGVVLDPGGLGGFGYGGSPGVAACGSNYLVVWLTTGLAAYTILAQRFGSDGTALDATPFAVASGVTYLGYVAVAGSTNGYLVVWNTSYFENSVSAKRLNRDGTPLDPDPLTLCSAAAGDFLNLAVASDGSDYLVVWDDYHNRSLFDDGIFGVGEIDGYCAYVPGNGAVAATCGHFVGQGALGGLASDGANYLLTSQNDFGLGATWLSRDGVVAGPSGWRVNFQADTQLHPAVAFNGSHYLVVWADNRNWHPDIYGVRVSPAGAVVDPGGLRITTSAAAELFPALASNGTDWFVAWEDQRSIATRGDIYGTRVTASGRVLDPAGRPITTETNRQTRPAIAGNGSNYLVVWHTQLGPVGAARVDFSGAVLDAPALRLPALALATAVASDGSDYLIALLSVPHVQDQLFLNYGAVISGTGLVNTNVIFLGQGNAPAVAWNGQTYLVAFSASLVSGLVVARVARDGTTLGSQLIAAAASSIAPAASAVGDRFFVVWKGLGIHGANVAADGAVLDPSGFTIDTDPYPYAYSEANPRLAHDGLGRYLLIQQAATTAGYRIVGRLITLDPPVLQSVAWHNGTTTLSWSAYPGRTYRLQYKNSLADAPWLDLPGEVTAQFATATHTDPTAGSAPTRFYRVVQSP